MDRQSYRYSDYNYSEKGQYFITICTSNRVYFFGDIYDGVMCLSPIGEIVKTCWLAIVDHFPNIKLHDFVIMPNHIHGILEISYNDSIKENVGFVSPSRTIGSVIRGFKIGVSCAVTSNIGIKGIWQRNYHDHIIRNQIEYLNIARYIVNNPKIWKDDKFY